MHGTAAAKVPRAWRGTATLGRSEARAPGRLDPGSGIAGTARMPIAKTVSSADQITLVGAGAYTANRAVSVAAENRNWAWYTRYSGDAAAEAKNTIRNNPAMVQNAAALGSVLILGNPWSSPYQEKRCDQLAGSVRKASVSRS